MRRLSLLLAAVALVASSCGPEPGTPEEQVLTLIGEAESAAEAKDLSLPTVLFERFRNSRRLRGAIKGLLMLSVDIRGRPVLLAW